jgi:hypothetical protein
MRAALNQLPPPLAVFVLLQRINISLTALMGRDSALTSRGEVAALLVHAYLVAKGASGLSKACPTHFALVPKHNLVSYRLHSWPAILAYNIAAGNLDSTCTLSTYKCTPAVLASALQPVSKLLVQSSQLQRTSLTVYLLCSDNRRVAPASQASSCGW